MSAMQVQMQRRRRHNDWGTNL